MNHLPSQLSAASEHNGDLFCKQHDQNEYDCQHDVAVFQHFFAQDTDSHIVFFSKKNSCNIRNYTNNSACKHFHDQQNIVADRKYCHSVFPDLIHNNGIQAKGFYKIGCHKNKHGHTCNHRFLHYSEILCIQPHETDIPLIWANVEKKNHHGKKEAKYRW